MENIKIWLIGDTHFGYKGDDQEWLDDYAGYFEDVIIPLMKEKVGENDILVHCGDVFDNRSSIGLNTISRVVHLFEEFGKIFNDIRIVVGNHDMGKKTSTDMSSLDVLKYVPNVKVYYQPEVDVICGKTCLFNPWYEDFEKEKELLAGVNVNYIFGHIQIGGSKTADRSGVKITLDKGVGIKDFKSAQVYAGHIHIRQDNKNVHYVGNPYHKDRGDRENVKGITVLDIRTGETEFIENTVTPRYMDESIYSILNMTVGELKERWRNNRIDLHIKGEDSNRCTWDTFLDAMDHCYRDLEKKNDITVLELNTSSELKYDDMRSGDDYIREFIEKQGLDDDMKKEILDKIEEIRDRI